ncbi:ECF transporter S component [Pyrococcus furiosus DSM 3638]|nr:hypothetical protein PFC_07385 [Pyrococcus furiosus COM1]QEK77891.1 ECF transporter S component [Pyrococcus furiosus DSM 3638]
MLTTLKKFSSNLIIVSGQLCGIFVLKMEQNILKMEHHIFRGITMKANAREIAFTAIMTALALVFQVLPLKVRTPWGMSIDLVAVPVVLLYLLFGFRTSMLGLVAVTFGLMIISGPNSLGIGPIMKFFATLSVLIGLIFAEKVDPERTIKYLLAGFVVASVIRSVLMILLNYYFALPIYLKFVLGYDITSGQEIIRIVEEMMHMPFWLAIALPNTIQTAVDVFVAYLVVGRVKKIIF